MQSPDQVRYCKILGHNSKKIVRICIAQQNCPTRYLCEQCLKTTSIKLDQCITLEQLKVKVREARINYSQTQSTQDIILSLMNKLNQCKSIISQQFSALEQKIVAIQMNIKNQQQNALQALDLLDENPLGFNENTLMNNLSYLNYNAIKEYQLNLQKGQHFLKQSFNTLHEQTIQFKLIGSGHSYNNSQSGISINSWQIKGIDNYLLSLPTQESHKYILFYSQKTSELMYQIQFILYMKKAPNNRAGRKVLGQFGSWDNHILRQEDNIVVVQRQDSGLKLFEIGLVIITILLKNMMIMENCNIVQITIIVISHLKLMQYFRNTHLNKIFNKRRNNNLYHLNNQKKKDLVHLHLLVERIEKLKDIIEFLFCCFKLRVLLKIIQLNELIMNILLLLQLVQADLYTIRNQEIKTLFSLPLNAQDLSLQAENDQWNICYIKKHHLDLEYASWVQEENITNLAMVSLSQHSMLVITNNQYIDYLQDQTLLRQIKLPNKITTSNLTMKYCQETFLVFLITERVYSFNPYDQDFFEPQLFLDFRPQQLEIVDSYIFVLQESTLSIYFNLTLNYTINFRNNSYLTYFSLAKSDNEKYIIYLTDKYYGLIQVEWKIQQHEITQLDIIQNGIMVGCSNASHIFVIYQRQFKYIIAQYRVVDLQYQIQRKIYTRSPIHKIIVTKDYAVFQGKNKILLLIENQFYQIEKFGIRDLSLWGMKLIGISAFESFHYVFQPLLASVECFYSLEDSISQPLKYALTYSEINKTIQKFKIEFEVDLERKQQYYIKYVVILVIITIILIMLILYSYMLFKQKQFEISGLENNLNRCKVKQIPLFKSLECVVSPKGQHSKLQSFDQTSNFDLMKRQ